MKIIKQWRFIAIWTSLCATPAANAQFLDEIEFRREGADAVAQVKFVTAVQYAKSVGARNTDLLQVFYVVRPTTDQILEINSERRIAQIGALPSMIVTDESDNSAVRVGIARKLVIRFGSRVRFKVRPGRDDHSLDIVLEGLGPAVRVGGMSSPGSPANRRFVVTLQSASVTGQAMIASVPIKLQDFQVFTTTRRVDGKTFYDVNVGYFATQQEAEAARTIALARFPNAVVSEVKPQTAPPAPVETTATVAERAPLPLNGPVAPDAGQPPVSQASADIEAAAAALLATAQMNFDGGNYAGAIESLNELLNLPANSSSRRAQELAGLSRLNAGDPVKANSEFELFLKLYPVGPDSDRVRQLITVAPAIAPSTTQSIVVPEPTSTTTGSVSTFYYGGNSDVRTREFRDSVLGGLPILQSDNALSSIDQKQLQTNLDLTWRFRDTEKDMRFVFRDAYSADLLPNGLGKSRLSALFFDYRSLSNGTSIRVGRQSPNGGGVLYRFDGLQAGYAFAPKWKVNAVYGSPADPLLDTRRTFYGLSIDAEALTKELGGSAYVVEQIIDGVVDRRGVGFDLRYFKGGFFASTQFDYDQVLNAVNIAAFQSTWQATETTMVNAMFDRRTTPIMSLGNVLFFQDPALIAPARRIQELLGTTPIETLREQVKGLTAYQSQARIGGTTAINQRWQTGADISVTNVDEIKPVAILLPNGQPGTGNLWNIGAQLIGTNLYSARDTHVLNMSMLGGPNYRGALLSYNNLSSLNEKWQLEPSARYYTQNDDAGGSNRTLTVGMRAVYRIRQQIALESELTVERAEAVSAPSGGTSNTSTSSRFNYSFGGRYDF
jgi:tetratricopeptide (TPR) repeat protein